MSDQAIARYYQRIQQAVKAEQAAFLRFAGTNSKADQQAWAEAKASRDSAENYWEHITQNMSLGRFNRIFALVQA